MKTINFLSLFQEDNMPIYEHLNEQYSSNAVTLEVYKSYSETFDIWVQDKFQYPIKVLDQYFLCEK